MTIGLLIALAAVNAGFLILLDRKDGRDRTEREMLLQRIQAPEVAVYDHSTRDQVAEMDGMPMSDEHLAEQEERARALQFIERYEVS